MEPLDQSEKRKAIKRFLGFFIASILFVFILSFFLFRIPPKFYNNKVESKVQSKNSDTAQQNDLIAAKTDKISIQINGLKELESKNLSNSSPDAENYIRQLRETLNQSYANLSEDTNMNVSSTRMKSLRNLLTAYDAILFYCDNNLASRQTITSLRSSLEKLSKGDNSGLVKDLNRCVAEKTDLHNKVNQLNGLLAKREVKNDAPSNDPKISSLENNIKDIQREKDDLRSQLNQKTQELNKAQDQLKNVSTSTAAPTQVAVCTDAEKAKTLFQQADVLYSKGLSKRGDIKKGYLNASLEILTSIQSTYAERDKLSKKINDIKNHIDLGAF